MGPLQSGDPERIGRYRLIGRLGSGGMGQVYFGRSAGGRAVAIKRIHPHMAADPSFRERFAREVTAARQVSGAFTAPVIDADPEGEVPWLVTSYVASLPLDTAVQRHGPLPEATLRVLAVGLSEALTEIHRCGLIHRDLKPGNVLLAEDGPRVIDFGIARATEGTAATQSVIGTPGFMSPQQVEGRPLTPKSDIFSLGAVLVYAASGVGPFGEGSMPTMVMRIMQQEPDLSAVPPPLQRLVAACLAKDERYRPDPGQVLDALGDVPVGRSWLPSQVMRGVHEQVGQVNAALAGGSGATVADEGATDAAATRAAVPPGGEEAGATSVLGAESGEGEEQPTAVAEPVSRQSPRTAVLGAADTAAGGPGDEAAYRGLYRGQEQAGEGRERQRRDQGYAERERREREQRRRVEEREHQERVRAEREAARRAQRRARQAGQPSLWRFASQLPLLLIPLIQFPLGVGAAYAWQWFTATDGYWGSPWYYEGVLSGAGALHALYLGYFLFNNGVGAEWLLRSLRTGFVVGVLLAVAVIAGTNGALWYFGFFG